MIDVFELILSNYCSDPSSESDPSNEYSLLWLIHVMNSIFLDPSDEFLTQVVNIRIPKQILGFHFHVSKRGYKIGYELTREENLLEAANALTSYRGMAGSGRSIRNWPRCQLTS